MQYSLPQFETKENKNQTGLNIFKPKKLEPLYFQQVFAIFKKVIKWSEMFELPLEFSENLGAFDNHQKCLQDDINGNISTKNMRM